MGLRPMSRSRPGVHVQPRLVMLHEHTLLTGAGRPLSRHCKLPPNPPPLPQVATTPDRLTISLKWYGRVLDGQLHLHVKPSETHWCLEDREVGPRERKKERKTKPLGVG